MKLSFSDFFKTTDWRDDLLETARDSEYYRSFNEQVYGVPFEYDDVAQNLPEYAEMMGIVMNESKRRVNWTEEDDDEEDDDDEGVDYDMDQKKEKKPLIDMDREEWETHRAELKNMMRPKRNKKGRLMNPHAGVHLVSPGDNNPKTEKGYDGMVKNSHTGKPAKFKNAVMHLLPAGFSGCNTCKGHTPECAASCLDVAGNPGFMGVKTAGRTKRTFMFAYNKGQALLKLAKELEKMSAEAKHYGYNFGVRLNGTSDVFWEDKKYWFAFKRQDHVKVRNKDDQMVMQDNRPGKRHAKARPMPAEGPHSNCPDGDDVPKSIFCHFPEVQFYDYTKITNRAIAHAKGLMPPNYHLTFSYSEKAGPGDMEAILDAGGNIAVVFAFAEKNWDEDKAINTANAREQSRAKKKPDYVPKTISKADNKNDKELVKESGPYKLPKVWRGDNNKLYKIVSGDIHDLRFIDDLHKDGKEGVIVGLAAKGDAKFVRDVSMGTKKIFVVQPNDPHIRYEPENRGWVEVATAAHPARLKYSAARQKQDDKFVAELRARAAKTRNKKEKAELLARADRIEHGDAWDAEKGEYTPGKVNMKVNYFGAGAQRQRSDDMYKLFKEPEEISDDHTSELGLDPQKVKGRISPFEALRAHFKKRADQDLHAAVGNAMLKAWAADTTSNDPMWEAVPRELASVLQARGKLSRNQLKAFVNGVLASGAGKSKWEQLSGEIQERDFDGFDDFKQKDNLPHWQADDPGQKPKDMGGQLQPLGMDRIRKPESSALQKYLDTRVNGRGEEDPAGEYTRRDFHDTSLPKYDMDVHTGSTATPTATRPRSAAKRGRVLASESANPYLGMLLEMCD